MVGNQFTDAVLEVNKNIFQEYSKSLEEPILRIQ